MRLAKRWNTHPANENAVSDGARERHVPAADRALKITRAGISRVMRMRYTAICLASVVALAATASMPAAADDKALAESGLHLELNRLEQNGAACRATLIARNGFETNLEETAFELVMFDKAGLIGLMTVFDFGSLPEGKTLVRRFDLPQIECTDLTRILVNGVSRCSGEGIDIGLCQTNLITANRAEIEFGR